MRTSRNHPVQLIMLLDARAQELALADTLHQYPQDFTVGPFETIDGSNKAIAYYKQSSLKYAKQVMDNYLAKHKDNQCNMNH